ncbi:MAG: RraA family protein [Cyclobacteriaceae bacterium]|nr:RraA family protein [Cyclobacteriaceae bacterium]
MEWSNDIELFELLKKELYTPVLGDILDEMGLYHCFLPQAIRPLQDNMKLTGRAMPVLMADVYGPQEEPFGKMTYALDDLRGGEIYVATGGTMPCAYWGEILTATARTRGAVGALINGYHRDTPQVLEQHFPVFSRGCFAQDSRVRTRVIDFRCPVEIEGIGIAPGDLIFGDIDGVLVVPGKVEKEAVERALEKARKEKSVRKEIENGMSSTEAFRKYGVL